MVWFCFSQSTETLICGTIIYMITYIYTPDAQGEAPTPVDTLLQVLVLFYTRAHSAREHPRSVLLMGPKTGIKWVEFAFFYLTRIIMKMDLKYVHHARSFTL